MHGPGSLHQWQPAWCRRRRHTGGGQPWEAGRADRLRRRHKAQVSAVSAGEEVLDGLGSRPRLQRRAASRLPPPPASPCIYLACCLAHSRLQLLLLAAGAHSATRGMCGWRRSKCIWVGWPAAAPDQHPACPCPGALLRRCRLPAGCPAWPLPPPAPRQCSAASADLPLCAGAYDIAQQAACGHDVAALRKGRTEEGLNFPASFYAELAPLVQHLPQVSLQGLRGGRAGRSCCCIVTAL